MEPSWSPDPQFRCPGDRLSPLMSRHSICNGRFPIRDTRHPVPAPTAGCLTSGQVVQQVRFIPKRNGAGALSGVCRSVVGTNAIGATVVRTGDARPGPCGDRTCEIEGHVRGNAIRTCTCVTAYVVVRLVVIPRPPGRLRRAGTGGRDRSDPPFPMPAVASAEVGTCTPSQPPRRVAPGQQSHAGRP